MTTIKGFATAEGTAAFAGAAEAEHRVAPGHYRKGTDGLMLSSLGMGTYLGNPDAETDADMREAARQSIASGAVNVLDCAINYRYQASERALGQAVAEMVTAGEVAREALFICTKNGFITPDAAVGGEFRSYFQHEYVQTGIVNPADIAGGIHCMSPKFLDNQLDRSRHNLGLETIDLMYLHNAAESQLSEVGRERFMARLEAAFTFYETARAENRLRYYGLAAWTCFCVEPRHPDYLSLADVVALAESIAGRANGFRFIQLPYNMAMTEAHTAPTQTVDGKAMTALKAATALGIGVFTSVPLMQGQLLHQPHAAAEDGLQTPAQRCLQFVRSTPGVIAPLAGHKRASHVADNLTVATVAPLSPDRLQALYFAPVPDAVR